MERPVVAAVDFGNTKIAFGVVDARGAVLSKEVVPTEPDKGVQQAKEKIFSGLRRLIDSEHGPVEAVGLAFGGLVDETRTIAVLSPNFPGWSNVPLVTELQSQFAGLPVVMDNDANAAGWGEYRFGSARGCTSAVYLTVSTGVGGAVILDGRLWRGRDSGAGEFGHMIVEPNGPVCSCGGRGCLEAIASGPSIARRAQELMRLGFYRDSILNALTGQQHVPPQRQAPETIEMGVSNGKETIMGLDAKVVCEAARAGDSLALTVMQEVASALGTALANIAAAIAPEVIVLGGGVMNSADLFLTQAVKKAEDHLSHRRSVLAPVRVSSHADDIALLGAAALALDRLS